MPKWEEYSIYRTHVLLNVSNIFSWKIRFYYNFTRESERVKEMLTKNQSRKENAAKTNAETQLTIANKIIQQSNQTKELPKL